MPEQLELHMVMADEQGSIYDDPDLLMVVNRGGEWGTPKPDEVIPLPRESELFLLPGRKAVGLDPESGETMETDYLACAAFAAPGYTLSAHPAYARQDGAPLLPLFAYGAVGFADERFWICARRVDRDPRQQFTKVHRSAIRKNMERLLKDYAKNRLVGHILKDCVARYDCPAARNFALGRYEAPLPSSQTCNARCVGCISEQAEDSPIAVTPQCRLDFTPTPEEVCEVMRIHEARETKVPVYSFGQGCEGDPLMNPDLLCDSVRLFREGGGRGTINCNTNASRPDAVARLADAGLTSLRASLNSAREEVYNRYYRPHGYSFEDVKASIRTARERGIFVSLNLLFFPGVTDTERELEALADLCGSLGVSMIQWRNLNIDPEFYLDLMQGMDHGPSMGLHVFMKRLKKACPWLRYGYFNPYLGDRAELSAPMPGTWSMPQAEPRACGPEDGAAEAHASPAASPDTSPDAGVAEATR
ncbi:MAG: radical SAM protein [Desulfovibrio sp.]|nr:radical SAM protein [Desulfovibrio sp.]